jgi:hypothetical protein
VEVDEEEEETAADAVVETEETVEVERAAEEVVVEEGEEEVMEEEEGAVVEAAPVEDDVDAAAEGEMEQLASPTALYNSEGVSTKKGAERKKPKKRTSSSTKLARYNCDSLASTCSLSYMLSVDKLRLRKSLHSHSGTSSDRLFRRCRSSERPTRC